MPPATITTPIMKGDTLKIFAKLTEPLIKISAPKIKPKKPIN